MPRNIAPTPWAAPSQTARASRYTPLVGEGAGRGAAFLAATFLAGAFFTGAVFFAAVFLAGAAFFAGPGPPPTRFAVPAVPWEPLPDVREAMGPRLPVYTPVNTCAYRFTRPCRPAGAGN